MTRQFLILNKIVFRNIYVQKIPKTLIFEITPSHKCSFFLDYLKNYIILKVSFQ